MLNIDKYFFFRYKGRTTNQDHTDCDIENRCMPSVEMQNLTPLDSPGYLSVHMTTVNPTKLSKFLQLFHCLAKRTLDDSKRFSSYYATATREPNFPELEKTENKAENSERFVFNINVMLVIVLNINSNYFITKNTYKIPLVSTVNVMKEFTYIIDFLSVLCHKRICIAAVTMHQIYM